MREPVKLIQIYEPDILNRVERLRILWLKPTTSETARKIMRQGLRYYERQLKEVEEGQFKTRDRNDDD